MMVYSIAWQDFSWEAFATLTTGLSAVGAAVYVARKQSEIQRAQVAIQDLELRSDLFERRYTVFDGVKFFLLEILRLADSPSHEAEQQFLIAMGEAKFLFNDSVVSSLDEIWKKACQFHALKQTMKHTYQAEGHYGEGNPQRAADAIAWFSERLKSLPSTFEALKLVG